MRDGEHSFSPHRTDGSRGMVENIMGSEKMMAARSRTRPFLPVLSQIAPANCQEKSETLVSRSAEFLLTFDTLFEQSITVSGLLFHYPS
jgi:hypothetical protein